ncbi:FtsB family cell division protein [Spongiivirga citrea]|uniref:Septum formation initiator family protein n=1 Tax=Spongiivirga citrea TaxID=1481457 RepID=A0A6M0CJN9_9FLAO|nr:septum formation initiator family protein [Spongiivirga citrea]NER15667.1 septum formation initiator family protein [Spongiivirga citrea]
MIGEKINQLKRNKYFKFFSNRYILVLILFSVWMLFLDANSLLTHRKINREMRELNQNKEYYQKEISADKKMVEDLKDPRKMEKFAREEYWMKKKNEDIYLVEIEE